MSTLSQDLISAISVLNRLSGALSSGVDVSDSQSDRITNILSSLSDELGGLVGDLEEDVENKDGLESIPESKDEHLYSVGETCLLLDPFDNYRVFNLYLDYANHIPLDISDGQKLYLIFRSNNKEIRIPEYNTFSPYIKIDKVNGQVLFKINKKQATDILSMSNRTFYITRVYESYNSVMETSVQSDEEVIFSGFWADRNTTKESNLTQTVKDLQDLVTQRDEIINGLTNTIMDLSSENATQQDTVDELNKAIESLQQQYDDFREAVEKEYPGFMDMMQNDVRGEILDSRTVVVRYDDLEENMRDAFDELTGYEDPTIK